MLKKPGQTGLFEIHNYALSLLERTGVLVENQEALDMFDSAGAEIKDGRAYLPRALVEGALAATQESSGQIQLYSREGLEAMLLKNGNTFFGPGSDALYQIDLETGKFRNTTLNDISMNAKLADVLSYDFVMSMGLPHPGEVDPDMLYATVFSKMIQNTSKPIVTTLTTLSDIKKIHDIGAIAAGGKDALREKPFFLAYLEPMSPLRIDNECASRILYCAENEIPYCFAAGANIGATAPIKPEWAVIQGHAESLSGMVLGHLKEPNLKFVYGANTSSMDMRTTKVGYGAPEWFKTVSMYAELGTELGLPSWGTAGCSDSFQIDAQAGSEAHEGILLALQSGSTLVHDMGYLAHGELNDPGMHVLTNVLVQRARNLLREPDYSSENLAEGLTVIDDVARGGQDYISHISTCDHFRDALWLPPNFWERRDTDKFPGNDLSYELRSIAKQTIEGYQGTPLSEDKVQKIAEYLA